MTLSARGALGLAALILLVVLPAACEESVKPETGKMLRRTLTHDGIEREYFVYVPRSYATRGTLPVVIALHGYGGTATGFQMETSKGFNRYAERKNFIAVYPQGTHFTATTASGEEFVSSWNDLGGNHTDGPLGPLCTGDSVQYPCPPECGECGRCQWASCHDDVGFIGKMLQDLPEHFQLDRERIYLTGMSNGATMAQRLACAFPERFAAVALVVGRLERGYNCAPAGPVRLLQVSGNRDTTVPPDGGPSDDGYYYTSAKDVAAGWAAAAGCTDVPVPWSSSLAKKHGMQCTAYRSCRKAQMEVIDCLWLEGGHVWPGEETGGGWCVGPEQAENVPSRSACPDPPADVVVWGTELIWDFFDQRPAEKVRQEKK